MRQTNTRSTVEAGIMSAVAIVFALISAYVPVIGVFVNLIWPVPIILLGIRHGFRWSVMATVVAGAIIAILMHPLQAISIVIGFGLIGIVLGHAFRSGFGPFKAILWGAAASLVSKAAVLSLGFAITGINPLGMFESDMMDKVLTQVLETYRGFGVPEATLVQMQDQMKAMFKLFQLILPGAFVLASVFDTYLNFVVARAVLRKLGHHIPDFPPFKEWTLPQPVLYAFMVAVAMLFFGRSDEAGLLFRAGLNIEFVTRILLVVQGLALFYYLADKYNLSRLIRNIILVLILTNGILSQLVVFAGVYDLAVDYRRLKTPRPS